MDQGVENTQQPAPQPQQTSEDAKTIVTVLLLIFFFPVGLILMWLWPAWSKKMKMIITALYVAVPILVGLVMMLFIGSILYSASKFYDPINVNDLEKKIEKLDAGKQNSSLACFDACESSGSNNDPATRVLCIQSCVKQVENDVK